MMGKHHTFDAEVPVKVVLVPHSHWDREWYEPFAVFLPVRSVGVMVTRIHWYLSGVVSKYVLPVPTRTEERNSREEDLSH